jgi:chemotaxis protein MotD
MTAGVTSATVASFTPAAGLASRQTDPPSSGFGEELDKTGSRDAGQKTIGEAGSNVHRWRRHDTADAADDVSALKRGDPEGELDDAETKALDNLPDDEVAPEEGGSDVIEGDDGTQPGLSAQTKAEHAISAMMALAPVEQPVQSDDVAARQKSDEETADQANALQAAKAPRLAADSAASSSAHGKGGSSNGAQTAGASIVTDAAADQTQANGSGSGQNVEAGEDGKAPADAIQATKVTAAGPASSQPATQDRPAATEPQKPLSASDDGGSSQSNAGTRDQRDDAPEARRTELQSATVKVSVVSQQAVPAPAAPPALGANAAAIVSTIDAFQSLRPLASSSAQLPQNAQPIQSLKIQLHPAELGTVTANLRAAGGRLSVELHVENHEAYRRLSIDSDAIVKSLQALGYDIDRLSIQQPQAVTTSVARPDASAGAGSFSRDTSSSQSGNSGGSGERFGGQASGRGDRGDAQGNDRVQPGYQDRAGGGLYI